MEIRQGAALGGETGIGRGKNRRTMESLQNYDDWTIEAPADRGP